MANTLEQTLNAHASQPRPQAPTAKRLIDGEKTAVPLDLLSDNPFQPRLHIAESSLKSFAATIAAEGLMQPIVVRPTSDGRFITVAGHRRRAAFRLLRDAATTPEERARYEAIPAIVKLALDDRQLSAMAFIENSQREDLTLYEAGRALERMVEAGLASTNEELAALVKEPLRRVQRLRRIATAPDPIVSALSTGVLVTVGHEDDGAEKSERRRLDLMSANLFCRLHDHLMRTDAKRADARTESAVKRALVGNWPLRRVEKWVDDAVKGKVKVEADEAGTGGGVGEQPLFAQTPNRFTIDKKRLGAASAEQLTALRDAFAALLAGEAA